MAAIILLPLYMWQQEGNLLEQCGLYFRPEIGGMLLGAACLLIISRQLYYYAYANTDVANITVFSALTPIYALGAGYMTLGEVPQYEDLGGLLLICAAIYTIFLKRDASLSLLGNMAVPFRNIIASPPIFAAFLSTIPTAFAAVFQKQLLATLSPVSFSFALLVLVGLGALLMECIRHSPVKLVRQCMALPWHFFIVSAILLAATHILFCMVMQTQQTAISLVLQRSAIVFQIVLAYFLLKEKESITKRVIASFVIMAGFALIMKEYA